MDIHEFLPSLPYPRGHPMQDKSMPRHLGFLLGLTVGTEPFFPPWSSERGKPLLYLFYSTPGFLSGVQETSKPWRNTLVLSPAPTGIFNAVLKVPEAALDHRVLTLPPAGNAAQATTFGTHPLGIMVWKLRDLNLRIKKKLFENL